MPGRHRSTARTPIGRAYRGVQQHPRRDAGRHVISHAVKRAGLEPGEVEDVILGCTLPEGATGQNIARQAALRAGLPVTTSGATVNRFCSSGLQAIAIAAQRVLVDRVPIMVAGGLESVSLVQNEHFNNYRIHEAWIDEHKPEVYMPMLETAEVVAKRYYVTREQQDDTRWRASSGWRPGSAGKFDVEIVPLTTRSSSRTRPRARCARKSHAQAGRGQPSRHHRRGLAALAGHRGEGAHHGGQREPARRRLGLRGDGRRWRRSAVIPSIYRAAVAACEPDEMGIGLRSPCRGCRRRFTMDDIGLWS